jgi:hypothetical protein
MSEQNQVQTQRPVVLIGLGGTGKQTLQYLRRLFLDRYGAKSLPHIAMVVIDTDGREQNLDGSKYDEFDREVAFDRKLGELIVTPIGEMQGNVRRNRAQYPHIDNWLDRALDSRGDIHDGAGQIRSFGRLAFFKHYKDIKEAIHRAYQTVTSGSARDRAQNYNIELETGEPVETWVIFSVAGGTGSGMFLDMAFLAKQEARAFNGSEARSLILLPTAFSNDLPPTPSADNQYRPFANAYAALMELESYNFRQKGDGDGPAPKGFRVQWAREQYDLNPQTMIDGPVFLNSWLVDNAPRDGGGLISDRMDLCRMMAEWLFIQYSSVAPALSGEIRSARSNQGNVLLPLATISLSASSQQNGKPAEPGAEVQRQSFSRQYSGFGLSKIYIPTTNLANQAYAKLVADVATFWQSGSALSDVRKSIESRVYSKIHLPMNGATRGFTEALGKRLSVDGAGQPLARRFEVLIEDELRKLKVRNFDVGAEEDARDWFTREVMTKLLDGGAAAMARRGEISRIVQGDNAAAAMKEIRQALDNFLAETLRTPGERLDFAVEALRTMVKDYQQAAQQAEDRAKKEQQKGDRLQREIDELLRWTSDYKGFDRSTVFAAAFAKMRERAMAEFRKQIFQATTQTAKNAADYVGVGNTVKDADGRDKLVETGLLSMLFALKQTFQALSARAKARIGALQHQPTSRLNSRAPAKRDGEFTAETELAEIYKTRESAPIDETAIAAFEEELYKYLAYKGFTSPWYLREFGDTGGIETVFADMLSFARTQLSYLPSRMQDALDCLSKKYGNDNKAKFEDEVRKVIDRGSPWLPKPVHNLAGNDEFSNLTSIYYVAVSDSAAAGPKADTLKLAGVSIDDEGRTEAASRKVVDGPLDSVYFESEVAGVPLFAVRNIDLYRNAYLGYLGAEDPATRVVHTELNLESFVDLVPPTWEEYKMRHEAVCTFIEGVAKGVIVLDPAVAEQGGLPAWRFFESSTLAMRPMERRLGRYALAVRLLARRDRALCAALQREIAARDLKSLSQDDAARLFGIYEQMGLEPPIRGSEWRTAINTVLSDMRTKYGGAIVDKARAQHDSSPGWIESVPSGSQYPYLRLKVPAQPS